MEQLKYYSIDYNDHHFDSNGIENFFWPFNPLTLQKSFNDWVADFLILVEQLSKEFKDSQESITPAECLLVNFTRWQLNYILALQGTALKQGFKQHNITPTGLHAPFYKAYLENEEIPDISYTKELLNIKKCSGTTITLLRYIKDKIQKKRIIRLPHFAYNPYRHRATTISTQKLEMVCQKENKLYVYIEPESWLKPIEEKNLIASNENKVIISRLMEITLKNFSQCVTPDPKMTQWLKRQFTLTYLATQTHNQRIMAQIKKHPVPKEIVCSLNGSLNRLFRFIINKQGSKTILFDHGCSSMLKGKADSYISNMLGTSIFYTYTNASAELAKKTIPPALKPFLQSCEIQGSNITSSPTAPESNTYKQVILLPLNPFGDRLNVGFYPSDIQAMDFNHKIINALKKLNYEVILKPHPDYPLYTCPQKGEKIMGCKYETQSFETILPHADIILSLDPTSTCMVSAILSKKPILTIDSIFFLNSMLLDKITKRVELIPMHYNKDNRIEITWENLKKHIESAIEKKDDTTINCLYNDDGKKLI